MITLSQFNEISVPINYIKLSTDNCSSFWNINKGVRFVDMKLPQRVESGTWEDLQIFFDEKFA